MHRSSQWRAFVLCLVAMLLVAACDLSDQPAATPQPTGSATARSFLPLPPPTVLTTLNLTPAPGSTAVPNNIGSPTPQANSLTTQVDTYLNSLVDAGQFSGSVLLAREGNVLLSKGYGLADIENSVPNTAQTKFRIASITKQFTATAVMMLQQEGKLSVEESVCRFVEECPQSWQAIKIRHLLTHTSGLPTDIGVQDMFALLTSRQPLRDGINLIKQRPLISVPGEEYRYSNVGYDLLGYVIEQASGGSYEAYLQEKIWGPLGMTDTGQDHESLLIAHRATGYSSPIARAPYLPIELALSAGGLYSTVGDLYKWDQALYTEKLLPKSALDVMFTPGLGDYGYGWNIETSEWGRLVKHNGNIPGFVSNISRYPDNKVTVIVLSNMSTTQIDKVAADLAGFVFGGK